MSAKKKGKPGKPNGATKLKVCERRAKEWQEYARGALAKDLAKKYGVSKRTIDKDIATMRDEVMEQIREQASHDAAARALSVYYQVMNKSIEMLEQAEKEPDPKAKYQGMRAALGEMRGAQRDMDSLLVKAGFYEGDKAGVTINILSMPEDDAYGVVEKAMEKPEFAQALCNLLEAKGYKPDVEGEYEVLEDENDDKKR